MAFAKSTYPKITCGKCWTKTKRTAFPSVKKNPAFSFLRKDCALPSQAVFFKALS